MCERFLLEMQQLILQNAIVIYRLKGDQEKSRGETPAAMMDRDNISDLPQDQMSFIKFVCVPCYQTLQEIFPVTRDLLEGCRYAEPITLTRCLRTTTI